MKGNGCNDEDRMSSATTFVDVTLVNTRAHVDVCVAGDTWILVFTRMTA